MAITFGEARKYISQYAGKGGKTSCSDETYRFVKTVLQQLLYKGEFGSVRKFCFRSRLGCITAPFELETPLEVKIGGRVGSVWNKWFEWYQQGMRGCVPATDALFEEPNRFPTVYDIPACGARLGVVGTCEEPACEDGSDPYLIVQGDDLTGREIFSIYRKKKIRGVRFNISNKKIVSSPIVFGRVTAVTKSKTNGYVQLLAIIPTTASSCSSSDSEACDPSSRRLTQVFLSDYSPLETKPQYRRFRLTSKCPDDCEISILGRIRLRDEYADNDLIPFDNVHALQLQAQSIHSMYNDQVDIALAKEKVLEGTIESENRYKQTQSGQAVKIEHVGSPGRTIRNIF